MSRTRQRTIAALSVAAALPLLAGAIAPAATTSAAPADSAPDTGSVTGDALTGTAAFALPTLAAVDAGLGIKAGPTTHWVSPNATFSVKAQLTNSGQPISVKSGSVILEQKFGSQWIPVGKPAKLSGSGLATISAVSDDFQRETTYRVTGGDIVSNEFVVVLGAGKHTSYKLFANAPRWQPCDGAAKKPIVYQLNLTKVPGNWTTAEADIKAAIANVSAETGLVFKQHTTPTTNVFPTKTGLAFDEGVNMVIAAGDAVDSTFLPARKSGVLAVGGFTTPPKGSFISKGYVMIDNRQDLSGGAPAPGKSTWQMVVRHELAHAIGLTHPSDAKQIMNPVYNNLLTDWGSGDRNGLQLVGVRAPSTMVFGQTADSCG